MSGGGGPDPLTTVGEEVSKNVEQEEAATVVAKETNYLFSVQDIKTHLDEVARYAEAVAADADGDVKSAAADAGTTKAMSWTDFVVAHKRLSEGEINFILSRPRKPFESTIIYKDMIANSSTTKEDLEREAAEHEYAEDGLSELQERVRKKYAEKGFVAVEDNAIAERLELEQYFNETWSDMLSELGLRDTGDGN